MGQCCGYVKQDSKDDNKQEITSSKVGNKNNNTEQQIEETLNGIEKNDDLILLKELNKRASLLINSEKEEYFQILEMNPNLTNAILTGSREKELNLLMSQSEIKELKVMAEKVLEKQHSMQEFKDLEIKAKEQEKEKQNNEQQQVKEKEESPQKEIIKQHSKQTSKEDIKDSKGHKQLSSNNNSSNSTNNSKNVKGIGGGNSETGSDLNVAQLENISQEGDDKLSGVKKQKKEKKRAVGFDMEQIDDLINNDKKPSKNKSEYDKKSLASQKSLNSQKSILKKKDTNSMYQGDDKKSQKSKKKKVYFDKGVKNQGMTKQKSLRK